MVFYPKFLSHTVYKYFSGGGGLGWGHHTNIRILGWTQLAKILVEGKLDGGSPIDNRPSMTSFTTLSEEEEKYKCDT